MSESIPGLDAWITRSEPRGMEGQWDERYDIPDLEDGSWTGPTWCPVCGHALEIRDDVGPAPVWRCLKQSCHESGEMARVE